MAAATSSGSITRPRVWCCTSSSVPDSPYSDAVASSIIVRVEPGESIVAVMPVPAKSRANPRTKPKTPCFMAQ